jgi:hypothetical protein
VGSSRSRWQPPSPRLPGVIDQLKQQARARHVRCTRYVRSILERTVRSGAPPEMAEITNGWSGSNAPY